MKNFLLILAGLLFGSGLVISGMTNPAKVIGFLDFTSAWDPALAFVMGGALAVFGSGLVLLKRRGKTVCGNSLPDTSADPLSKQYLIGSAIFGIGWGLGGFCPGPALANLSTLQPEVLLFLATMLCGIILSQRIFQR